MKNIIVVLVLLTIVNCQLFAQEETLAGSGEIANGWFAAPVMKISQVKDESAVFVGGRGGWIINHTFVLGLGGYGLVSDVNANNWVQNLNPFLEFGYGGFEMEYIFMSDNLVHATVYTLIGGGNVTYRSGHWDDWSGWNFGNDSFFVIEPAVNAELNITTFMRLNAGVSYRIISGLDFDNLEASDISGPAATITLKFGSF